MMWSQIDTRLLAPDLYPSGGKEACQNSEFLRKVGGQNSREQALL